jgi:UDP-N-acetyl-D-mannosaminuronate dehydrogenase
MSGRTGRPGEWLSSAWIPARSVERCSELTAAEPDAITTCVLTPLSKSRTPDLAYIAAAVGALAEHLAPGQLVVLQST